MPNMIEVRVFAKEADIKYIKKNYTDKFGGLDFNKIIPMPKTLNLPKSSLETPCINAYIKTIDEEGAKRLLNCKNIILVDKDQKDQKKNSDLFYNIHNILRIIKLKNNSKTPYRVLYDYYDKEPTKLSGVDKKDLQERLGADAPTTPKSLGKMYVDNLIKYGATTWYSWRLDNWGCKWNACDTQFYKGHIIFLTPWGVPEQILKALQIKLNTTLNVYYDEGDGDLKTFYIQEVGD